MPCAYQCVDGFVQVNDEYVAKELAKLPQTMHPDVRSDLRTRIRDSWYPCPLCCPERHELWRGGHFAPNHRCETCRSKAKRRGAAA